jgi:glycosyltransferase involved in cell wall biosynthesis
MDSIIPNSEDSSISVVIASKGRPDCVRETIGCLRRQTLKPRETVVVVPSADDLPENQWGNEVRYLVGPLGLTTQRNRGIETVSPSAKYVGCFDDDFELKDDYLEQAVAFLDANTHVVGISGRILKDGGINRDEARKLIANYGPDGTMRGMFYSRGSYHILYGCNMVIRRHLLNYEKFDENLPFYSYGEDYDLSIRLEHYGLIGRFAGCIGVHLETPGGRVRELLRGYSFVANNWYFLKKGVVHLPPLMAWIRFWVICVGKSLWQSLSKLLKGDRSLDWGERVKGHLLAVKDIYLGRCHPQRIKEM